MEFPTYVEKVLSFREKFKTTGMLYDSSLYPFWSLRDCLVYSSPCKDLNGFIWKRGNVYAKGSMNSWKLRYFKMVTDPETNSKITLEYKETDDESAPVKGKIDLRDLISFDFSTKTVCSQPDKNLELICYKLLMNDGRRYVLASTRDIAVKWGSAFTWYSTAGKLISEWRDNFGDMSKDNITLRDWVNAAMVIIRMQRFKAIQKEGRREIDAAGATQTIVGKFLGPNPIDEMVRHILHFISRS